MSVVEAVKSNALQTLGIIEHAVIVFNDSEKKELQLEDGESDSLSLKLADNKLKSANALMRKTDDLVDKARNAMNKNIPAGKVFRVQFNPSTIQISAVGGGNFAVTNFGKEKTNGSVNFAGLNARVDVSMRLIFDAVNNKDAFAADKVIMDPTEIAKGVGTAVKTGLGKNYSVQAQVEGFHAAMRMQEATIITFMWGKMVLEGSITRLNTRYTMFSPMGAPIRAEANITITTTGAALNNWVNAYNTGFKDVKGIKTQRLSQRANGLLNL